MAIKLPRGRLRRWIPTWRYWLEPPALVSAINGAFWVVIGVSGISDIDIAWQFLVFGVVLTLLAWWTVAYSSAKADGQARGLKAEIRQGRIDASIYDTAAEKRYQEDLANQQRKYDAQMAQMTATHRVTVEIRQQLAQAQSSGSTPGIQLAALESAVTLAEAADTGSIDTLPTALAETQDRWVSVFSGEDTGLSSLKGKTLRDYFAPSASTGAAMKELQAALFNLHKEPPTHIHEALAGAKQLSSLSQAISQSLAGYRIAEHKADVGPIMPSVKSTGGHQS